MTRFWLVRHGPTHATGAVGWTDLPADLSDTRQVAALAAGLPEQTVMVSSDLRRAVDTADAIQADRTRLSHDQHLREIHFGTWEGRGFDEIAAEDAELARAYWDAPGDIAPPQGESWNDLTARVARRLDHLGQAHRGSDIVCVVHMGVILAALAHARALPARSVMGFQIDPLSLTCLDYLAEHDAWRVERVNHVF